MKLVIIFALLIAKATAQYPPFAPYACNACFGSGACFNDNDGLSATCTSCLQTECEDELEFATLASEGIGCIASAWQNASRCQPECPTWTWTHMYRARYCKACLEPCVLKVLAEEIGQCQSNACQPCDSCLGGDKCFTNEELADFGGICKGYYDLKCENLVDDCQRDVFENSCSECPNPATNSTIDDRLTACSDCLVDCAEIQQCVGDCSDNVQKYPTAVPCPVCRAFCKVNLIEANCEATYCNCQTCDDCYQACIAAPTENFNTFNPCECLNDEDDAQADQIYITGEERQDALPWLVFICIDPNAQTITDFTTCENKCAGALINDKWVLATANCLVDADLDHYSLILGVHEISELSGREVMRTVIRIEKESHSRAPRDDDLALIEMNEIVASSDIITPARIGVEDVIDKEVKDLKSCILMSMRRPDGSARQLNVKIPRSDCQMKTKASRYMNGADAASKSKFVADREKREAWGQCTHFIVCEYETGEIEIFRVSHESCDAVDKPVQTNPKLRQASNWICATVYPSTCPIA